MTETDIILSLILDVTSWKEQFCWSF